MTYIYHPPASEFVDKNRLLFLCKNYTSLTPDEGGELESLLAVHPYSQLIQSLAARAASQNKMHNSQARLHMAAVYSTDRAVLKKVVTASPTIRKTAPPVDEPASPKPKESPVKKEIPSAEVEQPVHSEEVDGDTLVDRVMADLEQLKTSKHNFELLLEHLEAHPGEEFAFPPSTPKATKKKSGNQELIDEIRTSRKKIKPSDPKHKEQIDLINQFIKSQPSIGKAKASEQVEPGDLSEKSNALGDHLVSETLVEILLKQGKTEKAIEMLRKLIWKFPQKKAYFAAQINNLKK
ncbi:MAG: hypothetical protein AB7K37_10575 [Cyclobacteriaceae bacterium]